MNEPPRKDIGTGELIAQALSQIGSLIRKEFTLARSETENSLKSAAGGLGLIFAGGLIALSALNVLAAALVDGIAGLGLDVGWAALIVGLGLTVAAAALVAAGAKALDPSNLTPHRTLKQVKEDRDTVKEVLQ